MATVAIIWAIWGSLRPVPVFHDEDAYVLQADIFARGQWAAPAPPLPGFFDQPHVLSEPGVAAKYPPGHSLTMVPGALVGWHALVPLVLAGTTAALLFALAARFSSGWGGLMAWSVWITTPLVARFHPSFFSQVTTSALVLAAWWSYLRWRESRRRGWMLLLAFAVSWGGITRPVSMLAFAIPLGAVALRDVARARAWRDLGPGAALGLAVFLVVPAWNLRTTGSLGETPVSAYRRDYLPFDRVGFVADATPPRRALTPVLRELYEEFLAHRQHQTLAAAPRTVQSRLEFLASEIFPGPRSALIPLAIIGVFITAPVFAAASVGVLLLFVAHVPYAHDHSWTVYYLESVPILAILCGAGAWHVIGRVARRSTRSSFAWAGATRSALLASIVMAPLLAGGASTARGWRERHAYTRAFATQFASTIAALPSRPAIVFVRSAPTRPHFVNVVRQHVDFRAAPVWVAHDLGARNEQLRRLAPERAAYLFDESDMRWSRQP